MTITTDDWIKDTIWREMHLTSHGWIRGSSRTEKGRFENDVEPPFDRILTVRCLEFIPADPKQIPKDWSEIRWINSNDRYLEEAQELWGVLPRSAPALSAESAKRHLTLKNIRDMRKSENSRPLGKKSGRWGW